MRAGNGLRMAGGISEHEHADRLLSERLLTIEWEPRDLPDGSHAEPGSWLLLGAAADSLTSHLGEALNADGAHCTTVPLPHGQWGPGDVAALRALLSGGGPNAANGHRADRVLKGLTGVVLVTAPPADAHGLPGLRSGRDYVSHLVAIARELSELSGEPPRLFVVTRNAASVCAGDLANLEQAGLRGLMRVIDSEHPHLGTTAIDVDDQAEQAMATRVAA